jgi:hypothetical protein
MLSTQAATSPLSTLPVSPLTKSISLQEIKPLRIKKEIGTLGLKLKKTKLGGMLNLDSKKG